jgi:hypothetical protein
MIATQWEYKVIYTDSTRHDLTEKELNAAGSDGWEAVATTGDETTCYVILKCQKSK